MANFSKYIGNNGVKYCENGINSDSVGVSSPRDFIFWRKNNEFWPKFTTCLRLFTGKNADLGFLGFFGRPNWVFCTKVSGNTASDSCQQRWPLTLSKWQDCDCTEVRSEILRGRSHPVASKPVNSDSPTSLPCRKTIIKSKKALSDFTAWNCRITGYSSHAAA